MIWVVMEVERVKMLVVILWKQQLQYKEATIVSNTGISSYTLVTVKNDGSYIRVIGNNGSSGWSKIQSSDTTNCCGASTFNTKVWSGAVRLFEEQQ